MAGLLDLLMPNRAQQPDPWAGLRQAGQPSGGGFLNTLLSPEIALPMAAQLMGQQGNSANFGNALGAAGPAFAQRAQTRQESEQKNRTLEYLRANAPEYAGMVEAGMPVGEAWGAMLEARKAQKPDYKVVDGRIFNTADQSWLTPPGSENGMPETGLVPQLMQDEQGNMIYVQPTKDGRLVQSQAPDGYRPVSPYDRSLQTSAGKNDADKIAGMSGDIATSQRTVAEIDQLAMHPGLSAIVGPLDQFRGSWTMGSEGRDALARYNQLKGRAFLQAFATLKGGGQITEIEGQKAQDAMARMDRAQGEEEFKVALRDFRDAVDDGMRKLRAVGADIPDPRAGSRPQQQGNRTSGGVQWSVEP